MHLHRWNAVPDRLAVQDVVLLKGMGSNFFRIAFAKRWCSLLGLQSPELATQPRDASAAAVMASAFYELSNYSQNRKGYKKMADKIIQSLTKEYRNAIGANHGFILSHSTGHKPAGSEIDVPLIYADYYYLEGILRSQKNKIHRYCYD